MSSVLFGFWFSMVIAIIITFLSSIIGIFIGLFTGYYGGIFEIIFMRIGDVILSFPGFLLIIIWISVLGSGFLNMVLIMSFMSWVIYARLVRGEVLKNKDKDFVLVAKTYNASNMRIIFIHIFPQIIPLIIVQISIELSNIIIVESGLNFLGLGTGTEFPTLGQLVYYGQRFIFFKPELVIFSGVSLFLLIISINLIGEGLRLQLKE
jgi:peptide/nickel transport system permease protein